MKEVFILKVLHNGGVFSFKGELDFGIWGTLKDDDIYLGYADDYLLESYDFRNDDGIKLHLPKGDFATEIDYINELILNLILHAHKDISPYLDSIYNEIWYNICEGWINCAYPFWGDSPTEKLEPYIFPEKMPTDKTVTQDDFSHNFYTPNGAWLCLPKAKENQRIGDIFTKEIRNRLFPMVDFDYIDKTLHASFTLLGSRFGNIGMDSPLHNGMLFCGVMGEMKEDYTIWVFHNH